MAVTDATIAAKRSALDEALQLASQGERDALRTIFDLTSAKLLGVIVRIVPDRELAEDVLQEVYLRVWRRAGRFDSGKGSAIAWLATIARNCAIDEMRRRPVPTSSGDELLDKIVDEGQPVDDRLCDREEQAAVQRCLEELQQDHRKSIRLAFFGGLTHSQLAERLNVPLGTLKSWIKRGLANLKVCLGYE